MPGKLKVKRIIELGHNDIAAFMGIHGKWVWLGYLYIIKFVVIKLLIIIHY